MAYPGSPYGSIGFLSSTSGAGFGVPIELIINAGIITVSGVLSWRSCSIDTEGGIPSDDLVTINGGNTGEFLLLQALNNARTIVCKKGLSLRLQADFLLNNTDDKLLFVCISPNIWHEVSRSSSGA